MSERERVALVPTLETRARYSRRYGQAAGAAGADVVREPLPVDCAGVHAAGATVVARAAVAGGTSLLLVRKGAGV